MSRHEELQKSILTLFPHPVEDERCPGPDCNWETVVRRDESKCRVCSRPAVDGRRAYCSDRCKRIARAVQRMFIWDEVRDRILERDDYTCQECGWSRDHIERVKATIERTGVEPTAYDGWDAFVDDIPGLEVDHVTRLADGGHPFDSANLATLCERCHAKKTAEENSGPQFEPQPVSLEDFMQ